MVVTRSHCLECRANGRHHDARDHNRGANAAVRRDAARVAASRRASARSRDKKNSRALRSIIPTEGKHKRAHRRATVPHQDATSQHSGREATRGTKPRATARPIATATNGGRGSKPEAKAAQSIGTGSRSSGQSHASGSGRTGVKRGREDGEEDIPGPEGPARRIRRRLNASPREGTRRSARLASRLPVPAPQASFTRVTAPAPHASSDCASHNSDQPGRRQVRGHAESAVENRVDRREVRECAPDSAVKSEHDDGCSNGSVSQTESSGRTLVAGEPDATNTPLPPSEQGESSLSPSPVKKEEEEVDLALLTGFEIERSPSLDSTSSGYDTDTDSSGSRSSSVESFDLATPEPVWEAGVVRVHHDEESLTPLGNSPLAIISEVVDEEDQEEFLPLQLPNDALAGEADDDDEADEGDNDNEGGERRRSLAPEPEDGLLVEIRQGRIPGLASPERWTGEE